MHLSHLLLATGLVALATAGGGSAVSLCRTPPSYPVDLARYVGKWYEIGTAWTAYRFFERDCTCVEADYSVRPDGTVRVANTCVRRGVASVTTAVARSAGNPDRPGDFIVRFDNVPGGGNLFGSTNYIVSMVWGDYEQVLVGGTCSLFMWVLARTPEIPDERYDEILYWAQQHGFSLRFLGFRKTPQDNCPNRPAFLPVTHGAPMDLPVGGDVGGDEEVVEEDEEAEAMAVAQTMATNE